MKHYDGIFAHHITCLQLCWYLAIRSASRCSWHWEVTPTTTPGLHVLILPLKVSRLRQPSLGPATPLVSQHFPKDPRCLSSRARRSICLTAARGARRRRCLERKRGEAHVAGLGGDTLGDAAAQINADTLPVCAEWKLRNGVCVSVRICLFPFTAVVYIPSGCYPKSSSLSHILSSSLPPLLFLYVPVSSAVCFSQFLKGEI